MNWTNREIARIAKSAKHRRKVSVRTRDEQGRTAFQFGFFGNFGTSGNVWIVLR